MSGDSVWHRIKKARLVQVLIGYLAASWIILQLVDTLGGTFELPEWVGPVTLILLVVGFLIVMATAWVQSHPVTERLESRDKVPGSWEVAPGEIKEALSAGKLPHLTWARALLGGVVAFSVMFGLAGLYVVIKDRGESFAPTELVASDDAAPALAVLPFSVRGEGLDIWREGMVDALSANLDGAADLRAIDSRTVLARWRDAVGEEEAPDLATAMNVAQATGARWALLGSVISSGSGVRLSADVHDVGTGEVLGDAQVEGSQDSIFVLVDELSIEVLRSLYSDAASQSSFDLARITTHSVPALKLYLEGEAASRRGDFDAAIPLYQRAIEQDSTFGLAHFRLYDSFGWAESISSPARRDALNRARQFADQLPAREALLLRADYELSRGNLAMIDSMRMTVRRYPDDAEAWYQLADAYLHSGPRIPVTLEEVEETFARVVELDPNFAPYLIHWVDLAMWLDPDSAKAAARMEQLVRAGAGSSTIPPMQVVFDLSFGDSTTRAARLEELPSIPREDRYRVLSEGLYHGRFAPMREAVILSIYEEVPTDERRGAINRLYQNLVYGQGKLEGGLGYLADPAVDETQSICRLGDAYSLGLPVKDELTAALDSVTLELEPRFFNCPAFYKALVAAERGDWTTYESLLQQARDMLNLWETEPPNPEFQDNAIRNITDLVHFLEAQGHRGRGDLEEAVATLEQMARPNDVERWWMARLYMELDRPEKAERYLRSFWWREYHHASYYLGKVYEDLGQPEQARDAYQDFVEAWVNADPELQPMVEEAKQALARLMDNLETSGS
jgi:tetratricopeptide (TPR) repeat protein